MKEQELRIAELSYENEMLSEKVSASERLVADSERILRAFGGGGGYSDVLLEEAVWVWYLYLDVFLGEAVWVLLGNFGGLGLGKLRRENVAEKEQASHGYHETKL